MSRLKRKKVKGNKKIGEDLNTFEPIPLMINQLGICPKIS